MERYYVYTLFSLRDEKLYTGFTTNLKEDDWEKFRLSIEIRNRITHPKHSSDLLISEDEIETVMQAHDWFFKVFNDLQKNEINLFG